MEMKEKYQEIIQEVFYNISKDFFIRGATLESLKAASTSKETQEEIFFSRLISWKKISIYLILSLAIGSLFQDYLLSGFVYESRCYISNNYLIWEFSRPVSNCDFCKDINSALILPNVTREEFEKFAYSSRPIVVKGAAKHWKATKVFSLKFFKNLYDNIEGAYKSVTEECQFLNFKSNFSALIEVFEMGEKRAKNDEGEEPWYVGWKNCHPAVLEVMNKYYETPHFLPEDAEIPQTNYVFMGYEQGAIMHLDYIPRLMWQGQLIGRKTWVVAPTPECDNVCNRFNFSVNTGDIVLLDTRIWYHGTFVQDNGFSLTVTSEYG